MVGGEVLDVTVTDTASLEDARRVLADYAVGPIHVDVDARLLAVPTKRRPTVWSRGWSARSGTREYGSTRLTVRRPSLDDVFLELTGHVAEPDVADDEEAA